MRISPQARLARAVATAIPDRVVARALTHPPRRRWPALVPDWLRAGYDVQVTEHAPGRVVTATARSGATGRRLFYLHGGAYTLGPMHWDSLRRLLDAGWTISLVDYPLAPEHTVEETVPMVLDAWQHSTAAAPGPVDVMGDSAGGGLALVLLQRIRDLGLTRPGRAVLYSPWVDLELTDPVTVESARHDPALSLRGLRGAARLYAAGRDLGDPLLSPINGNLDDLGDLQVWVGTREMFLPQCCRLADLASRAAGTRIDLRIGDGMIHDWPLLPIPEGIAALHASARFLR